MARYVTSGISVFGILADCLMQPYSTSRLQSSQFEAGPRALTWDDSIFNDVNGQSSVDNYFGLLCGLL